MIITGGTVTRYGGHLGKVSKYNMQGWVEDLPQLIEGRYAHGCGSYLREDGTQVSVDTVGYLCVCVVQVLLVLFCVCRYY